jgi:thermostable 8-oxoguanine DNA glycosylase
MSSLTTYLLFILLCFCVIYIRIIDGRSIHQDNVEEVVDSFINNDDQHLAAILVAYRHRFQQSKTYKALRWSQKSQIEPPVCELCDVTVPLVS